MSSREYPARPLVGIGVVLIRTDEVLLVRRAKPPAAGSWSLPGGAQKLGETAEAAARRELREEAGLEAGSMRLAAHVDSIHYDAAGLVQYHYTILDFAAPWLRGEPRPGGDVSEARFVRFACLGPYELWDQALRVIAIARGMVSSDGDGTAMPARD